MGLKVVTYEGSDNAADSVLYIGGSRLNRGTPTAIPDADAALVKDFLDGDEEGHQIKVGNAAPKGAEHGSVCIDGDVVGVVRQPAVAEAEAEEADADEPAPATS